MKFTKSVRNWFVAAVVAVLGWYLLADTTIFINYTTTSGQTMSPSAAQGWCNAGQNVIGSLPPGCGQENGPIDVATWMLLVGIAFGIVALIKAYRAEHSSN